MDALLTSTSSTQKQKEKEMSSGSVLRIPSLLNTPRTTVSLTIYVDLMSLQETELVVRDDKNDAELSSPWDEAVGTCSFAMEDEAESDL